MMFDGFRGERKLYLSTLGDVVPQGHGIINLVYYSLSLSLCGKCLPSLLTSHSIKLGQWLHVHDKTLYKPPNNPPNKPSKKFPPSSLQAVLVALGTSPVVVNVQVTLTVLVLVTVEYPIFVTVFVFVGSNVVNSVLVPPEALITVLGGSVRVFVCVVRWISERVDVEGERRVVVVLRTMGAWRVIVGASGERFWMEGVGWVFSLGVREGGSTVAAAARGLFLEEEMVRP